jgi:hypothetical protein
LDPDSVEFIEPGHGIRIRIWIQQGKMALEKGNKILNFNVFMSWMFSFPGSSESFSRSLKGLCGGLRRNSFFSSFNFWIKPHQERGDPKHGRLFSYLFVLMKVL